MTRPRTRRERRVLEFDDLDITPTTDTITAHQADKWTVPEAIAEAIDNSFGPDHGDAANVWLTWNSADRVLTILDDGVGMTSPGLLLRLGKGEGRSIRDIARYGSGGTMLCLWLADEVEIHTIRADGRYSMAVADWKRVKATGRWSTPMTRWIYPSAVPSVPADLDHLHHGTLIVLKVPRRRSISPAKIIEVLEALYAPGLRSGKRIRFRHHTRNANGAYRDLTSAWQPAADARTNTRYVKTLGRDVPVDVTAWVDPSLTREESVVRIAFGHRVVKVTSDPFKDFSGLHVTAIAELGPGAQDYLTKTKNDINDDEFYEQLVDVIHEVIRPLLQEAQSMAKSMLIEGITMNLAADIAGLFDPNASVPAGFFAPEPEYTWQKGDTGTEVPEITPKREPVARLREDEDGAERLSGGHTGGNVRIDVQIVDGKAIPGGLFAVKREPSQIRVELNGDHEHVKAAVDRGSPGAERILRHTVLEALAVLIVEDEKLSELMLPKRLRAALLDRDLPVRYSRLMAYLLAQKVEVA